jgi:hypothetical protein
MCNKVLTAHLLSSLALSAKQQPISTAVIGAELTAEQQPISTTVRRAHCLAISGAELTAEQQPISTTVRRAHCPSCQPSPPSLSPLELRKLTSAMETVAVDPEAKRIGRLRALVSVMLGLAAVAVGVGSFLGVSYTESQTAQIRFDSIVASAANKLDDNVKNYDISLKLMAKMAVELHPDVADWPTAILPNFYNSAPLAMELAGSETIALAINVKPEDVSRYETFIFNYWDSDPAIPKGMAGYYSAAGDRGIWAVNETSNGILQSRSAPYHGETYSSLFLTLCLCSLFVCLSCPLSFSLFSPFSLYMSLLLYVP